MYLSHLYACQIMHMKHQHIKLEGKSQAHWTKKFRTQDRKFIGVLKLLLFWLYCLFGASKKNVKVKDRKQ